MADTQQSADTLGAVKMFEKFHVYVFKCIYVIKQIWNE